MTTEGHPLGFYGKIPIKGDFLSRQLPRTFIDPWDQWLQESIATSRSQLNDQWLESYLTAPIWRFALSKGTCDEHGWIGVILPSVDRVGRYFPLTLVAPVNHTYSLLRIADQEQTWFEQVEQIALSALEQDYDFDKFHQAVNACELPYHLRISSLLPEHDMPNPEFDTKNNWRVTRQESDSISGNLRLITEHYLRQNYPELSLWWTSGSEKVEPSILICNKLPDTQGFSALLTANWDQWGWNNILTANSLAESGKANPVDDRTNSLFNDVSPVTLETPAPP